MELSDIFKLTDAFHESALLHFAVHNGIFDMLEKPALSNDIAEKKEWNKEKTRILLNSLVTLNLIQKKSDKFKNTTSTAKYLTERSPDKVTSVINHQRLQWEMWGNIENTLSKKGSKKYFQENRFKKDEVANSTFNLAMKQLSNDQTDELYNLGLIKNGDFIIDICGGHGTYLIKLAKKLNKIRGEVWDLPASKEFALKNIASEGVSNRISFSEKNIFKISGGLKAKANVVLLNDCLHYFPKDKIKSLFEIIKTVILEGGHLLILTPTLYKNEIEPKAAALFSVNMMLNTEFGELHSTEWISKELKNIGLKTTTQPIGSLGRISIIIAKK